MRTVQVVRHAGPDRIIHLSIPVDAAERSYRLTVTIEPEAACAEGEPPAAWPREFLDRVVGAWEGDFELDNEGDFEKREQF